MAHIVPLDETTSRTGPRRRSRITREYLGYIDQLEPGKAGRVHPAKGATIEAVRRRLGKVVKLTDKSVKIKRVGEEIYFSGSSPKRNGPDATKVRQQGPDPVYRASKLVPGDGRPSRHSCGPLPIVGPDMPQPHGPFDPLRRRHRCGGHPGQLTDRDLRGRRARPSAGALEGDRQASHTPSRRRRCRSAISLTLWALRSGSPGPPRYRRGPALYRWATAL